MIRVGACLSMAAAGLVALAAAQSSCARQGEGERCDIQKGANGTPDSDCADGLNCTDSALLQHHPAASICCPADGSFNTIACTPRQGTTGAGGAGSTSAATGGGMGGSTSSGNAATSTASATSTGTTATATGATATATSTTTGSGGAGGH